MQRRSEMQETHHEIQLEMTAQEQVRTERYKRQLEMLRETSEKFKKAHRRSYIAKPSRFAPESKAPKTPTSARSSRPKIKTDKSFTPRPSPPNAGAGSSSSAISSSSRYYLQDDPEILRVSSDLQILRTTSDHRRSDTTQLSSPNSSSNVEETSLAAMPWLPRRNLIVCALIAGVFLCALLAGIFVYVLNLPFLKPFFPSLLGCLCGTAQDTFRSPHHVSINNNNNNNYNSRKQFGFGNYSNKPPIESTKILGFVGVLTSFSSVDRRAALRSTWFPSNPDDLRSLEQATGLVLRFVIGRSKDAKKMADLEKEIKRYSDFLLIDVEEESVNLPNKTLASFKAAYDHFEADYYVKANDNIYLRPDRLSILLAKERTDPMTYIGCMKGVPLISGLEMKWSEKSEHLIGYDYFVYGYGSIYVLSEEIVATLAVVRNNRLRMFSNEDLSVGTWMLAMNVNHEDNRALCHSKCKPTTIAVWDFLRCSGLCKPVNRLKELHKISMCSKSPTLPSD